jgi:CRP-like cAMP-binding protein
MDLTRFSSFAALEPDDLRSFELISGPTRTVRRGAYLRHEGAPDPEIYRLRSGWLACSLSTAEGGRQITRFHVAGDLVGLPSLASHAASETIQALTEVEIETIPLQAFGRAFREYPRLAALLFLWAQEDSVHLMNLLALVGRMPGHRRVAALILILHRRLLLNDPAQGLSFAAPLTQQDVADATGMSIVHANRTLRALRGRGIATWQDGMVTIHNAEKLAELVNLPSSPKRSLHWL